MLKIPMKAPMKTLRKTPTKSPMKAQMTMSGMTSAFRRFLLNCGQSKLEAENVFDVASVTKMIQLSFETSLASFEYFPLYGIILFYIRLLPSFIYIILKITNE